MVCNEIRKQSVCRQQFHYNYFPSDGTSVGKFSERGSLNIHRRVRQISKTAGEEEGEGF